MQFLKNQKSSPSASRAALRAKHPMKASPKKAPAPSESSDDDDDDTVEDNKDSELGSIRLGANIVYCLNTTIKDEFDWYPAEIVKDGGKKLGKDWKIVFFKSFPKGQNRYCVKITKRNFNPERQEPAGGWCFAAGRENQIMHKNGGRLIVSE